VLDEPILVDTDVASALYLDRYYDRRVSASVAESLSTRRLVISPITLGEAHYGTRKRTVQVTPRSSPTPRCSAAASK
jgi:predicted nucleic acid-binding protein